MELSSISKECKDYESHAKHVQAKPAFPIEVRELVAYIRYRARCSFFCNYMSNLDVHPLHGAEWLATMNNNPEVKDIMRASVKKWKVDLTEFRQPLIGIDYDADPSFYDATESDEERGKKKESSDSKAKEKKSKEKKVKEPSSSSSSSKKDKEEKMAKRKYTKREKKAKEEPAVAAPAPPQYSNVYSVSAGPQAKVGFIVMSGSKSATTDKVGFVMTKKLSGESSLQLAALSENTTSTTTHSNTNTPLPSSSLPTHLGKPAAAATRIEISAARTPIKILTPAQVVPTETLPASASSSYSSPKVPQPTISKLKTVLQSTQLTHLNQLEQSKQSTKPAQSAESAINLDDIPGFRQPIVVIEQLKDLEEETSVKYNISSSSLKGYAPTEDYTAMEDYTPMEDYTLMEDYAPMKDYTPMEDFDIPSSIKYFVTDNDNNDVTPKSPVPINTTIEKDVKADSPLLSIESKSAAENTEPTPISPGVRQPFIHEFFTEPLQSDENANVGSSSSTVANELSKNSKASEKSTVVEKDNKKATKKRSKVDTNTHVAEASENEAEITNEKTTEASQWKKPGPKPKSSIETPINKKPNPKFKAVIKSVDEATPIHKKNPGPKPKTITIEEHQHDKDNEALPREKPESKSKRPVEDEEDEMDNEEYTEPSPIQKKRRGPKSGFKRIKKNSIDLTEDDDMEWIEVDEPVPASYETMDEFIFDSDTEFTDDIYNAYLERLDRIEEQELKTGIRIVEPVLMVLSHVAIEECSSSI